MKDKPKAQSIVVNAIVCAKCHTYIASLSVHDFRMCKCGAVSVDGGRDYFKRSGNPEDIIPMSVMYDQINDVFMGAGTIPNNNNDGPEE